MGNSQTGVIQWNTTTNTASWVGDDPVILKQTDTLTITFSGFPANSILEELSLLPQNDLVDEHNWTPDENNLGAGLSATLAADDIAEPDDLLAVDDTITQVGYFLSAFGNIGGTDEVWKVDPEVLNEVGHPVPPDGETTGDS